MVLLLATVLAGSPGARALAEDAPKPARIGLLRAEARGYDVFVGFRLDGA